MFIYKITNIITDKVYIGLTTKSVQTRFLEHCRPSAKGCSKLYKSMNKHGVSNFIVEEIDGANSISELNYKEQHYIYMNNSQEDGYNLASGGRFSKHCKETKEKMRQNNLGKKHSKETILKISRNNHWSGKEGSRHNRSKGVQCVETGIVYGSIHEASREVGATASNICSVLNGRRKTTRGLTFKYSEE